MYEIINKKATFIDDEGLSEIMTLSCIAVHMNKNKVIHYPREILLEDGDKFVLHRYNSKQDVIMYKKMKGDGGDSDGDDAD